MQIRKVTTQNVSYSDTSENQSLSNSAVKLGIAATADAFEQKAALQPGSPELFAPPRLQPQSKADLMEARSKELGQYLRGQLAEYVVQIDESALTAFSATIMKGGKDGILNALGVTYGIAKLAMGPPQNDGISELLTSLITDPQQAEDIAMQLISDPEFLPISAEQLQTMYSLESLPFGGPTMVTSFFGQILNQKLQEIESLSQEQINAFQKFDGVIPLVFGNLGAEQAIRLEASFSE